MVNKHEWFGWGSAIFANGSLIFAETGGLDAMLNTMLLIIGIVSGILSIVYTLFKWYKRVTAEDSEEGKKITVNEVKDLIKEVEKIDVETFKTKSNKEDTEDADFHK